MDSEELPKFGRLFGILFLTLVYKIGIKYIIPNSHNVGEHHSRFSY
jgi:hypothetical protein